MPRALMMSLALLCGVCSNVMAQEFRVYTQVYDLDSKTPKYPLVRSLTLFHAGKVYDDIYAAGEVTIFEPTHKRMWIINSDKKLLARAEFEELQHLLRSAEDRMAQRIEELNGQKPASQQQLDSLRFQLWPQFETEFDPRQHRLKLLSTPVKYDVQGQPGVPDEALSSYLDYADWACRLNFVLHPQPNFPTTRLELNQSLRRLKLMPVEVTLRVQGTRPVNLQAKHTLRWTLDSRDRQFIHHWESLLRDSSWPTVSLSEYQRMALGHQTARAK